MTCIRQADHPIDSLFLARWSPRALVPDTMPEEDLLAMLEAARWAPSAYNEQPWRFFYAIRGDANFDTFVGLLDAFNGGWAGNAAAIVFVASDKVRRYQGAGEPMWSHSFDAGAAWAQFALQATAMDYVTHAMGGIDRERAPDVLRLPEGLHLEVAVAVGRRACPDTLPAELRSLEKVTPRRPVESFSWAGPFERLTVEDT